MHYQIGRSRLLEPNLNFVQEDEWFQDIENKDFQTCSENRLEEESETPFQDPIFNFFWGISDEQLPLKEDIQPAATPDIQIKASIQQLYDRVSALFAIQDHQLISKKTGDETGIRLEDIKNGLHEAHENRSFKFWYNVKGEKTHLVKKIGSGAFSKIYFFVDLNQGIAGTLKNARLNSGRFPLEKARSHITNEFNILSDAHADGPRLGIQAKPSRCVSIFVQPKKNPQAHLKERFGMIGPKFDHNYLQEIEEEYENEVPIEECLFDFYQLLGGLKNLDVLKLLHGDISKKNIFVRRTDKMKCVQIGDFGGASCIDHLTDSKLFQPHLQKTATPAYICTLDYVAHENYAKRRARDQLIEIQKKQDVFATGTVMYGALTKSTPYPKDSRDIQDITSPYRDILRTDVPDELRGLIKEMVSPQYENRPTRTKAFERIDQLIKDKYPLLHAQVLDLTKGYLF